VACLGEGGNGQAKGLLGEQARETRPLIQKLRLITGRKIVLEKVEEEPAPVGTGGGKKV